MRGSLVDSNVLVYAFDAAERTKQPRAIEVISRLVTNNQAILSVQCLSEFFNTVRTRISPPLGDGSAIAHVEDFSRTCTVLDISGADVLDACRAAIGHQLSIWDALIWSVAKSNKVSLIVTEDGQHGRVIEGVKYLNPFHSDFDIQELAANA